MSLHGLLDAVVKDTALAEAVGAAADGNRMHVDLVGPPAARPFAIAALARETGRPVLAVTATGREAEDLAAALRSLLPPEGVAEYPAWETLPHERLSPRSDTVGRRLAVLRRLAHPGPDDPATGPVSVVVAPCAPCCSRQVTGLGDLEPVALQQRARAPTWTRSSTRWPPPRTRASSWSRSAASSPSAAASSTSSRPPRSTRCGWSSGATTSRRSATSRSPTSARLEVAEHGLWAPPCRELLLTDDGAAPRGRALAEEHPELGEMLGKIAEGIAVEGMEALAPVLVDDMELLLDVLPAGAHGGRLRPGAGPHPGRRPRRHRAGVPGGVLGGDRRRAAQAPIDLGAASLWSIADVRDRARELGMPWWSVTPFAADAELDRRPRTPAPTRLQLGMHAPRDLPRRHRAGPGRHQGLARRRLAGRAGHRGPRPGRPHRRGARRRGRRRPGSTPTSPSSRPSRGARRLRFPRPRLRRPGAQAGGAHRDRPGRSAGGHQGRAAGCRARRRKTIDPLQLKAGDYVVHEQHGVGRYVEMVQRTVQGATREYLVVEYAPAKRGQPGDRLFVPTDQLDQVTRYVGGEAPTPAPARRRRLGQDQGARQEGRQGDRRRADPALLRPDGRARPRVRRRTRRGSGSWRTPSPTRRPPTS